MADVGIDYSVLAADGKQLLDLTFNPISDVQEVVIQSVYKKITTETLFYALDKTIDLRKLQNVTFSKTFLEQLKQKTLDLFSDEIRYQILNLDILYRSGNELYFNFEILINEDPNLVLRFTVVAGSNEVVIVRVQ
jgi:hypothetical protein